MLSSSPKPRNVKILEGPNKRFDNWQLSLKKSVALSAKMAIFCSITPSGSKLKLIYFACHSQAGLTTEHEQPCLSRHDFGGTFPSRSFIANWIHFTSYFRNIGSLQAFYSCFGYEKRPARISGKATAAHNKISFHKKLCLNPNRSNYVTLHKCPFFKAINGVGKQNNDITSFLLKFPVVKVYRKENKFIKRCRV